MKNITFINAGAGSGKTHRLTTDLAYELTHSDLQPSQVILTTFTELAAGEIKEKARNMILKAEGVDKDLRVNCATQLDNAFMGTVHSISYRFIRKYWYLLDYGADIQTMSDQNQDFYLSQSISQMVTKEDWDTFRRMRTTFDLKNGYGQPNNLYWLPDVKDIVEKMDYYNVTDVEESIEKSTATARKIFTGPKLKDIAGSDPMKSYLMKYKKYHEKEIGKKGTIPKSTQDRMAQINYFLEHGVRSFKDLLDLSSLVENTLKGFLKIIDNFEAVQMCLNSSEFGDVITDYIKCIFGIAKRWKDQLEAYKKRNHVISFNDMEKIFLALLTEEKYREVQQEIADTVRLLMVDEFQDSNPIQLKIFNRISELIAPRGGRCVWVGDPKQAIYGFRGSDAEFVKEIINQFEFSEAGEPMRVERDGGYMATDQLTMSWRSRPALVEFSNNVFVPLFGKEGMPERLVMLDPKFEDSDTLRDTPALLRWNAGDDRVDVNKIAAQIKHLAHSGQQVHHNKIDETAETINYADIAVLCRKNSECRAVAGALRKLGLPVSCEEPALMQCIEVQLVKCLLQYLQNPTEKLVRANLMVLLEDKSTEEVLNDRIKYCLPLDTEKEEDLWLENNETLLSLKKLGSRYKALSVSDTLEALVDELRLRQLVAKWGDAERRSHNLSTVINMAQAYDEMCLQMGWGASVDGFLNYLVITEPIASKDNSSNSIKVLSYHRSKGLEWPVVVLYSLDKTQMETMEIVKKQLMGVNPCVRDPKGDDPFSHEYYLHFLPAIAGSKSHLPLCIMNIITSLPLFERLQRNTVNEEKRLLYVGVTRAKDCLAAVVGGKELKWLTDVGIDGSKPESPWGYDADEHVEVMSAPADSEDRHETYIPLPTLVPNDIEAGRQYVSPSKIESFAGGYSAHEKLIDRGERGFEAGGVDNVVGSCIHDIFAVYDPAKPEQNVARAKRLVEQYGVQLKGKEEEIVESIGWLYGELAQRYGEATRTEHELPIEYKMESGQYLRGEIDLLWFYMDGDKEKCVLIDYKSFPGGKQQADGHTVKYYQQLSAYRAALDGAGIEVVDALVYYPVIGLVMRLK